jgi:hypothetical protein
MGGVLTMSIINILADILDNTGTIKESSIKEVTRAGWLGYFIGAFSLFIFACMFNVVPRSSISFLFILFAMLVANFAFSSMIHLSLESAGYAGNSYKMFLFFGITEFLWTIAVPLATVTRFNLIGIVFDIFIISTLVVFAKIFFIRHLYSVSKFKASLAFSFPCFVMSLGFFILMIYGLIWIFWLVI